MDLNILNCPGKIMFYFYSQHVLLLFLPPLEMGFAEIAEGCTLLLHTGNRDLFNSQFQTTLRVLLNIYKLCNRYN